MSFSDNLKSIRQERNISQEKLAEIVGVSRQAVSKWEQGRGCSKVKASICCR
ncbi:helix-turn-helix transcriptional regulator [Clostridium diolis]|uniref:helix-turn-helix transcriptional regulator n=1 Tax=Clostridium diolis TaxID=223919 RepID=UPI003AF88BE0